MRNTWLGCCLAGLALACALSVSAYGVEVAYPPTKLAHLKYRLVGVLSGAANGGDVEKAVESVTVVRFPDMERMLAALREGGIQAAVHETDCLEALVKTDPSLRLLDEKLREGESYALAVRTDDKELGEAVDAAMAEFKKSGALDRLREKWFGAEGTVELTPPEGGEGVLRYGVAEIGAPFVYRGPGGRLLGYDVELGLMVAEKLGRRLQLVETLLAELVPALNNGDVDMIGSALRVTPDRKEEVRFSVEYCGGGSAALVLSE